jgi:glutamate-1-semialdehyde aminotransferase
MGDRGAYVTGAAMPLDLTRSRTLFERARRVIPGGVPGIRGPASFVPDAYPILLAGARGGRIRDVDGNELVDLLMGYGPVIVGHAEAAVDEAAARRAREGFCLNLPEPVMVDLAERLVRLVPSAERVLFFKTGSGATSAAVRLARAHTGREVVLRCGYHGWHDWALAGDPGVPEAVSGLVVPFAYGDLDHLEGRLKAHAAGVAAILLTPIGHAFDRQVEAPPPGFLEGVRRLADAHGAVLVFDEIRTGFRIGLGGAQARYGVTPDLTALGKALGNGYPIAALVGRAEAMASATRTFISSTYFPNGLGMAAALATLDLLEAEAVLETVRARGEGLDAGLREIVARRGLPVTLSPFSEMPFLHFPEEAGRERAPRRDRFYAALVGEGVFAHPRHHGFVCARHDDADLGRVLEAVDRAATSL